MKFFVFYLQYRSANSKIFYTGKIKTDFKYKNKYFPFQHSCAIAKLKILNLEQTQTKKQG